MRRPATLDVDAVVADLLAFGPPRAGGPPDATVLDAASSLLGERGMRGWTVEDVAERAGVGRATVYRRFPTRDELVRAAIHRDAQRFFAELAEAVRAVDSLEEQVVRGMRAGLRLVRGGPVGGLLRSDPVSALSVLTAEPLLRAATTALADLYLAMRPAGGGNLDRAGVEQAAEGLVRMALSFVLVPEPDDDEAALAHLRRMVRPLLAGRSGPRR